MGNSRSVKFPKNYIEYLEFDISIDGIHAELEKVKPVGGVAYPIDYVRCRIIFGWHLTISVSFRDSVRLLGRWMI